MTSKLTDLKKNIIETVEKLFYEQGFDKTTYKQISSILDISPGSLSYHFDTKAEIGNIVYINYMQQYYNNNVMRYLLNKYDSYSPKLASAIEMRLQLMVFKDDKNVIRFYKELFNSQPLSGANITMSQYTLLNNDYFLGEESKEPDMRTIAAKGASVALITSYYEGIIDVPFDEFVDYKVVTVLKTTGIEDETAKALLKQSKEIVEGMNIEIQPYFKLAISPKLG